MTEGCKTNSKACPAGGMEVLGGHSGKGTLRTCSTHQRSALQLLPHQSTRGNIGTPRPA